MTSGHLFSHNWQICCYFSQRGNQSECLECGNFLLILYVLKPKVEIRKLLEDGKTGVSTIMIENSIGTEFKMETPIFPWCTEVTYISLTLAVCIWGNVELHFSRNIWHLNRLNDTKAEE